MSPTKYQFEPLSSSSQAFRLLNILPPADNGMLSLSLREHTIDTANGDYDALSYTWGSDSNMKEVLVDGKVMLLRENLWSFLSHCATTTFSGKHHRNLWIDAICIDQNSNAEKQYQVQEMRKIFNQARSVIVWLGDASKQSRVLQHFCEKTGQVANLENKETISWSKWDDFLREYENGEEAVADMAQLASHPYWSRLWIVQEVSLARDASFVAGDGLVPVQFMLDIARAGASEIAGQEVKDVRQDTIRRIILPRAEEKDLSLPELVGAFDLSECSVFHDRVYSMLGLVEGGLNLEVDYSLSIEELFVSALTVTEADSTRFSTNTDRRQVGRPEYDCLKGIESLASGLRINPDDLAKHAALREEIKKLSFSLPVSVRNVYEACHYDSEPLTYEDGSFKTAACFTRHPCSRDCVTEGFVGLGSSWEPPPCDECGRPIKANSLVEFELPTPQGESRNDSLFVVMSESGMRLVTNVTTSTDGTDTWNASFKLQHLPEHVGKELSCELIRDQVDLRRGKSRIINVRVSFMSLIELRRHTLADDNQVIGDGRWAWSVVTHLSEAGSVSKESCDEVKRVRAEVEMALKEQEEEREAYERMNPVQKLAHDATGFVVRAAGDFLLKGIGG